MLAAERLNRAIAEARDAGYLGANVRGSPWSFDLFVHTSAGRYICGEETALINALEGRRANPRAKPPFPQIAGLWGKPTVVNNVETLSNVPHIVLRGVPWFQGLSQGRSTDSGTKLYGVSGRVPAARPVGIAVRHQRAGNSRRMRRRHEGGPHAQMLAARRRLDRVYAAGAPRPGDGFRHHRQGRQPHGHGACSPWWTASQSILPVVRNLEQFFARESCGWCTPCRDGLSWTAKLLIALERGEGRQGDIETLEQMTRFLGSGKTFCAHAPGAMEPLQSALKSSARSSRARHRRVRRASCGQEPGGRVNNAPHRTDRAAT